MKRYFIDTCIWRDFYENRFSKTKNPLGKYAADFFLKIIKNKDKIIYSNLIITELKIEYEDDEIYDMLNFLFLVNILIRIETTEEEYLEAIDLASKRNLPKGDCLVAIQARNNDSIVVTQDKHFNSLLDIAKVVKPY